MKYYFIFLFQLIVLSSYGQKNKEAEIDSLESEMMNFFQATLERNYGRKDALDLLVKGLERYLSLIHILWRCSTAVRSGWEHKERKSLLNLWARFVKEPVEK